MQDLLKQEKIPRLDELYERAERDGIEVIGYRLPQTRAVSLFQGGKCVIGIDNSRVYSKAEEKTMLAHEMGHCETGAFYNEHSPLSLSGKCERRANEWAILNCVPYGELISAYRDGARTHFELAEHFGVSERLIQRAIEYYIERKTQNAFI